MWGKCKYCDSADCWGHSNDEKSALDQVERLAKANEEAWTKIRQLEQALVLKGESVRQSQQAFYQRNEEIDLLRAENVKLKKALEEIVVAYPLQMREIASKALGLKNE